MTGIVMRNHDMMVAGGIFAELFTSDFLATLTQAFMATSNFDALQIIGWGVKNTAIGGTGFIIRRRRLKKP